MGYVRMSPVSSFLSSYECMIKTVWQGRDCTTLTACSTFCPAFDAHLRASSSDGASTAAMWEMVASVRPVMGSTTTVLKGQAIVTRAFTQDTNSVSGLLLPSGL